MRQGLVTPFSKESSSQRPKWPSLEGVGWVSLLGVRVEVGEKGKSGKGNIPSANAQKSRLAEYHVVVLPAIRERFEADPIRGAGTAFTSSSSSRRGCRGSSPSPSASPVGLARRIQEIYFTLFILELDSRGAFLAAA